ncbi:MAG: hypothetical protein JRJ65_17760 [Deltaproteobacteria bacterium]|nr:hypothetical protein [Deltaproteobacteria bacterium]
MSRIPRLGIYASGSFLIIAIIFYTGSWIFAHLEQPGKRPPPNGKRENIRPDKLSKGDLPGILRVMNINLPSITGNYSLEKEDVNLSVETSLDTSLQKFITGLLQRSMTYQAAVVVLRPDNGQILAMANYENHRGKENLCLKADFPAASLFKVVSAAAAIEGRDFTPERRVVFRGKKHTLYRSQLKKEKGRYTIKTTFRKAFSGSINPVFGKIGIYDLGRELMAEYAERFFFNRVIPFELAEIASGFNKKTLISPVHAVLIASAVANNGTIMEPWLVRCVKDESGEILYHVTPSRLASPIKKDTAKKLRVLMRETVVSGTCRKAFRPLRRKKAFKDIELGAKTGMGIRAKDIARYIINYHFTS